MKDIVVVFENRGRHYHYRSPIALAVGQHALVNVHGQLKCVEVIGHVPPHKSKATNTIVGVGYMLEELDNQPVNYEASSIGKRVVEALHSLVD